MKKTVVKKKAVPKHAVYEPSHFVWLKAHAKVKRQPALVLYGEDVQGIIVLYVTPVTKGDTGRREVHRDLIEGRIT